MLAAKLGRVCGRGVARGEVRRGQALRSRRMLPEFPENMRTRRFSLGVWGKENLEELGELELGELEEGAWILRRRIGVAIQSAVRRGTADLRATASSADLNFCEIGYCEIVRL